MEKIRSAVEVRYTAESVQDIAEAVKKLRDDENTRQKLAGLKQREKIEARGAARAYEHVFDILNHTTITATDEVKKQFCAPMCRNCNTQHWPYEPCRIHG